VTKAMDELFNKHYEKVSTLPLFENMLEITEGDCKMAFKLFRYIESSIDWNTTCVNCARLLDSCYESDMRREQAEDALAVCHSLMSNME